MAQQHRTARNRAAVLWRIAWPLLVLTLLWVAWAVWKDAWWPHNTFTPKRHYTPEQIEALRSRSIPHETGWNDVLLYAGMVWFLLFQSAAIGRQMARRDVLAVCLVAALNSIAALFSINIVAFLWPAWFPSHPGVLNATGNILRVAIIASVASAGIMIALNTGIDRVRWPWVHAILAPLLVAAGVIAIIVAWGVA